MAVRPDKLKRGDKAGIIAPASPPDLANLKKAVPFFEETLGLELVFGTNIEKKYGYLAGRDEERAADVMDMFQDPDIKAIFCACGGYGTARMADRLDYEIIKDNPKIFWGYSDITYLHTAIRQRAGLVTFHGPMLASDIGKKDVHSQTKHSFKQLFSGDKLCYSEELNGLDVLVEGKAEGELVGGNLCLITSSLGTKNELDTDGKILFIEDVHEEPRNVDRYLNQLWNAGKLQAIEGLVIGDFSDGEPERQKTLTLEEVLSHYAELIGKPAMKGFMIGHCDPHFAIPLGTIATIDTTSKTLAIESGVANESNEY